MVSIIGNVNGFVMTSMMTAMWTVFDTKWLILILGILFAHATRLDGRICHGDIDIRNHPREFEQLRNCSMVAGSVNIVLMERFRNHSFSDYQFPELK